MQSFIRLSQARFSSNLIQTHPRFFSAQAILHYTMATNEANGSKPAAKTNVVNGKKEIKILMIHGFTQSGPLFRTKTRAMEKLLAKALTPFSIHPTLIYPTAPIRLRPSDIPGYTPSPNSNPDDAPDMWAWFRRDEASGTYRSLDEGMATIAEAIREAGGVDAVCGFSQGGCMTGLVTAALEPGREIPEGKAGDWARLLREANAGKQVRFAVSWSGFKAVPEDFAWCFEPKIHVPSLHYLGSLDTVVDETRSQELIDRCENPQVMVHPGGHHVPVSKEWVMPLAAFVKDHAQGEPRAGL